MLLVAPTNASPTTPLIPYLCKLVPAVSSPAVAILASNSLLPASNETLAESRP